MHCIPSTINSGQSLVTKLRPASHCARRVTSHCAFNHGSYIGWSYPTSSVVSKHRFSLTLLSSAPIYVFRNLQYLASTYLGRCTFIQFSIWTRVRSCVDRSKLFRLFVKHSWPPDCKRHTLYMDPALANFFLKKHITVNDTTDRTDNSFLLGALLVALA